MTNAAKDFKEFVLKGDVVALAVAVIIAIAFGAVIAAFVANIITPLLAAIGGQPDFSSLTVDIGDGVIRYGSFLNAIISFLFIALGVFVVVKVVNKMSREKGEDPGGPSETELLTEIRDLLASRQG